MISSIQAVYKSCPQEVNAVWLFCKHVMSKVTSSIWWDGISGGQNL